MPAFSNQQKVRLQNIEAEGNEIVKEFEACLKGEEVEDGTRDIGGIAGKRIKSFIQRVSRLQEEQKAIGDDIKEIWAEAKGAGFDVPTMKLIMKLDKIPEQKRRENRELLELYSAALGLQLTLPL